MQSLRAETDASGPEWDAFQQYLVGQGGEPIMQIRSYNDAMKYLTEALTAATVREVERFVYVFLGKSPAPAPVPAAASATSETSSSSRKISKSGGGWSGGAKWMDIHIYKLLAYIDSQHDFKDRDAREAIHNLSIPSGMPTVESEKWEDSWIQWMTRKENLIFAPGNSILNPAYGAKFTEVGYKIADRIEALRTAKQDITDEELYEAMVEEQLNLSWSAAMASRQAHVPVDIWTWLDARRKKILQLTQVARALCIFRTVYKSHIARGMVIDGGSGPNPLMTLMFALQYLQDAFYNTFQLQGESGVLLQQKTSKILQEEIAAFCKSYGGDFPRWNLGIVDANIFDSAEYTAKYPVLREATGPLFHPSLGYQINLNRVIDGMDPKVECEFIFSSHTERHEISNTEAARLLSKNSIERVISLKTASDSGIIPPKSRLGLRPKVYDDLARLWSYSLPFLYALKRAGDWGQVEHCVKYGKVFVTHDRLAALYAWCRGVPCIWFQEDQKRSTSIDFVQFRFVASSP
jgi:hypothetical protein